MVRILDGTEVERLLSPEFALAVMRDLFAITADPSAAGLARVDMGTPAGWLRILPGFIGPMGVFGYKTLHRTAGVGMRYAVYVHDLASGRLTGMVDGLSITNLRTGAVSALATDLMALPEIETAAIVGTGPVARGQALVLDRVRPARTLRVFARTPENRHRFMTEMDDRLSSDLMEATSFDEAITGAQLVTLATKATTPILFPHHLMSPGIHVNSVGPASRDRAEVEPAAFAVFDRVACDSVDLVMDEAGDAHQAVALGYDPKQAIELSAVVTGAEAGRKTPADTTLFKSVGTGLQDVIVAARLLEAAAEAGLGQTIDEFVSIKAVPPD